jgi:hypothetical protein
MVMGFFDGIGHLPLSWLGLEDIPAVPFELEGLLDSALKLYERSREIEPARQGLTNKYTINATTETGLAFLYGDAAQTDAQAALAALIASLREDPDAAITRLYGLVANRGESRTAFPEAIAASSPLQRLSLDCADQFSIGWTNYQDVYRQSERLIPEYAATLTDADAATTAFWPTIAENGLAYNLLMLRKVATADLTRLEAKFAPVWSTDWETLVADGRLYLIDLGIFTSLSPATVDGFARFTPATLTLLRQDAATKALTPIAVRVSGHNDTGAQHFVRGQATDSAWLYALQAAKTSVTVYGIWLGHVYHWHIVTAAMQMTMYNSIDKGHPIYRLVAPQANYLFQFDELLLLLWGQIAPPTSVDTARGLLDLMNTFATGRGYFEDDPPSALAGNGINAADFTVKAPWDAYPVAGRLLTLWQASECYVTAFVENTWATDALVAEDAGVQAWIRASAAADAGNVRGLPAVRNRAALVRVLTSLIFRITAHGGSRLRPSAYPAQAFVANFPPCLQIATIPEPSAVLSPAELLEYLPKTGTIGEMMTFYTTFIFSAPYVPFIPTTGVKTALFFPGGLEDPRNQALVEFREAVIDLIESYDPIAPEVHQWPMNIET